MDSVSQALYYVYRDASRLAQAYGTCFTPSELQGGDFRKHIEYLKKNGKYVCQDNDDIKKLLLIIRTDMEKMISSIFLHVWKKAWESFWKN